MHHIAGRLLQLHTNVRWKIGLFLLGFLAAVTALLLRPMLRTQLASRIDRDLRAAEAALQSGDAPRAVALAQNALRKARKAERRVGESLFVLGLARATQAENNAASDAMVYNAAAQQHLRDAARFPLAPEHAAKLKFHLAKCLHRGGQLADSIPLLEESLNEYPAGRIESLQLLTLAYLDSNHLDLDMARRLNSELMQSPGLAGEALAQAWELRRELLARLGRGDPIGDVDVGEFRDDARWVAPLVRACDEFQDRRFDAATASLLALVKMKGLPQPIERRAWYLIAYCAKEQGDLDAAIRAFRHQVEWRYPNSAEARAAATHTGAMLLAQGKLEPAVAAIVRAVQVAANHRSTPPLPLEGPSLHRVLTGAVSRLEQEGHFAAATELVASYHQIADAADADRLAAQLHMAWARATRDQARTLPPNEATQALYRADELLRAAGNDLLRAAEATKDQAESAEFMWRAAQHLADGKGYLQAVQALERLLATGVQGDLRAHALALCCAMLEACGRPEQIRDVATTCMTEFPDKAASVRARYCLARAQIGFGDYRDAEAGLRDVLAAKIPDVDPAILQQARLVLAHLLHEQGRDEEALRPIEELLSTTTDPEAAITARLLLADCLRQRARRPAARLTESHSPQVKSHYRQRKDSDLERAMEILAEVQRELAALERSEQLRAHQAESLHHCRRAMAECLFEADRLDEAIELYKRLAETYTAPADWLDAQIQIANCHVRMNRIESARTVLRAAQQRLSQQSPDALEQARVGMAPERWKEWLDWVRQL